MAKGKKKTVRKKKRNDEQEIGIYASAIVLIFLGILGLLNESAGFVGIVLCNVMRYFVGTLYGVIFAACILVGCSLLFRKHLPSFSSRVILSGSTLLLAWMIFCAIPDQPERIGMSVFIEYFNNTLPILKGEIASRGGLIGTLLFAVISMLVARTGTIVVLVCMVFFAILLLYNEEHVRKSRDKMSESLKSVKEASDKHKDLYNAKKAEKQKETSSKKKEDKKTTLLDWSDKEDDVVTSKPSALLDLDTSSSVDIESAPVQVKKVSKSEEIQEEIVNDTKFEDVIEKPYRLPKMALLDSKTVKNSSRANSIKAKANGEKIIEILKQFGIGCELIGVHIGPSVTKFEIKPDLGVRVNRIAALQDDIKMALAAKDIRIEAPIPGKSAVGIEVPNEESTIVKMHDMLMSIPSKLASKKLLVALGKDISGNPVYGELDKMPHLLVAGATGSGKSVCMNAMICSLLMRCTPDDVKLVLIDPKRVEFTAYHGIPHLITPVISDPKEASKALKVVVEKMDERYERFAESGVRNIASYNEKVASGAFKDSRKPMPYIVVIVDELADLMMVAGKEVEGSIQRLTQLARAAGIHLIIATQRPSVDVITGVIKGNIPSRIAFAVSSAIDSRTILEHAGAERLLGYGDMLYVPMGEPNAIRVQGAYLSDEEVANITDYVKMQAKPVYDEVFRGPSTATGNDATNPAIDPMYEECKEFVIENQKASTSLLQRRFGLGYNRAARLIDLMEQNGIVGPSTGGSKPREVYVKKNKED
ncbi:MAG: DNA translocase FtsK [Erysipelotrichaceae bacterium]|nr:DNA translocase FtsK [Erysipelotrichaceae bacterium]